MVNKEEVLEIVEELKTTIDLELKAYHEITDKRSKIIKEAEQEADEIIADAEELHLELDLVSQVHYLSIEK